MHRPSCGTPNRTAARFCTNCGAALDAALVPNIEPTVRLPNLPSSAAPIIVSDTSNIAPVALGDKRVTVAGFLVGVLQFAFQAIVFLLRMSADLTLALVRALF